MKVTFLGTGTSQGVPVIACPCEVCTSLDYRDKRLRSSALISINGKNLVIDTGPDFRQQMLRHRVTHLHAVLFTHAHKDHTAGLDDVRAYNYLHQKDMPVYGMPAVHAQLKQEFYYAFGPERYPGVPQLHLVDVGHTPFFVEDIEVVPLPVEHMRLPVLGFRVGDFSYITDANYIPEETYARLRGTRTLALNALQKEKHISHFNLEEAIAVAQRIGAERTYFIHISHKLGRHQAIEQRLPPGIRLAHDGLELAC